MSIDTRLNRPNGESSHAPEERNHSEHGRRKPGDSRFAVGSSAGYPYKSPYYSPPEKDRDAPSFAGPGADTSILAEIFPAESDEESE
jgi:hypothetical protein